MQRRLLLVTGDEAFVARDWRKTFGPSWLADFQGVCGSWPGVTALFLKNNPGGGFLAESLQVVKEATGGAKVSSVPRHWQIFTFLLNLKEPVL